MKKDNDFSRTVMVKKENNYQEYIVYAKYQIVSTKAVVQDDFPAYAAFRTTKGSNSNRTGP